MTENISSNKTQLQLRFDLKSKVRRISLKLILLNHCRPAILNFAPAISAHVALS